MNIEWADLPRSMTTINQEIAAGHEGAGIAQRKQGRATELFRLRKATQHVLRFPEGFGLWRFLEDLLDHRGHNVSWTETVDADALTAPLHGEAASQLNYGSL